MGEDKAVEQLIKSVQDTVADATKGLGEEVANLKNSIVELRKQQDNGTDIATVKGKFAEAIKSAKGGKDAFRAKAAFLNEGTAGEGGYLVPTEFYNEVIYKATEYGLATAGCTVIPMGTDTKDISSISGSVTAYWTAEGAAYTGSKPTFAQMQLVAKKLTVLVPATLELIDDNMTNEEIWTLVTRLVAEELARFIDDQVFNGDGTGSNFSGIRTVAGTVAVTTTGTTFSTLSYDNLVDAVYGIDEKHGNGGAFYMHKSILGLVKKLKDDNNRPILEYVGGEAQILGYPVKTTKVLPALSATAVDTKFIVFGDLRDYALGMRKDLTVDFGYQSGEWEKDILSMKASKRIAGKVLHADGFACIKTAAS